METIQTSYVPKGDTRLGDGCWLGMRAMIMLGVTIGEGAIIAAGSVVTRDVDPYTVVGGNPARPIASRFDRADYRAVVGAEDLSAQPRGV